MPRDLALAALNSTDDSPGSQERYLEIAFKESPGLDERDKAFVVHLVQGVLRWRIRLDWIVRQSLRFPFRRVEPPILNILRLALYQIFFMDRVPERAAVDEAVKQARSARNKRLAGFVNGILRHICREKDRITFPDRVAEFDRFLSLYYAYPLWLIRKWIRELGSEGAEQLLEAGNQMPERVVRANTLKSDRRGLMELLDHEGVKGSPCVYSPVGATLPGLSGPVTGLRGFREGLFQVQGEAAQICSYLLNPRPGDALLDVCAGLGGKSTHLAELMTNRGQVFALDTSHVKLRELLKSAFRLQVNCVLPVCADGSEGLPSLLRVPFDKILVDGPCSGLGVISRHPDIKFTKREEDIARLARLQKTILDQAAHLLKKGGSMLYVTCTISREENEGVVEDFLKGRGDMVLENLRCAIPEWGSELIDDNGLFRTFPHLHGTEGFFGALFRKMK